MKVEQSMNPFWMDAKKDSIEDLLHMLEIYTLDPFWFNYRYASVVSPSHYHPNVRTNENKLHLTPRFLEVSWNFEGKITPAEWLTIKKAMSKNMKTERFQEAFKDLYNAVHLSKTIYLNQKGMNELKREDKWWIDSASDLVFPIESWWCEEFKEEWRNTARFNERARMDLIEDYEVRMKFITRHWATKAEYDELLTIIGDRGIHKVTRMHQARRHANHNPPERMEDYKEFTLQSTGRRLMVDMDNAYSFSWYEIDPVISKPEKLYL